ncbi:MAG: restriction endonuclease [Psychroserpens sp.]|uniref:5-methylcytosine restriction system specificity protein McrC n=1 Tax=Psychroserpens sp. TaxID=2020870 RepID=UPI0030031342
MTQNFYEVTFTKTHRGRDASLPCFTVKKTKESENIYNLTTGYFIGVDWLDSDKTALYVAPKLNLENKEVDFVKMLFSSLRHVDVTKEIDELFEVKWDQPNIEIEQKQDLLTPFLVVEFLSLLKIIVRKGLKKSYYKVEKNLHSKVKGKILIGKSIKHNILQNKNLHTYCSYDEFGLNNKENRLLKKALSFVKRYLPNYTQLTDNKEIQNTFNYINPAFHNVSGEIELNEIKQSKKNAFYKEYEHAIHLAKLILKRFGYNISNTVKDKIQTPPFWIDMSKLFELYALGLLKDRFHNQVKFQHKYYGNELDYLLKSDNYRMVIDAKYKLKYISGKHDEDIRQVSGYARLRNVYKALEIEQGNIIDCLIIHPDQDNGLEDLKDVDLKEKEIPQYFDVYKVGLKLPHTN